MALLLWHDQEVTNKQTVGQPLLGRRLQRAAATHSRALQRALRRHSRPALMGKLRSGSLQPEPAAAAHHSQQHSSTQALLSAACDKQRRHGAARSEQRQLSAAHSRQRLRVGAGGSSSAPGSAQPPSPQQVTQEVANPCCCHRPTSPCAAGCGSWYRQPAGTQLARASAGELVGRAPGSGHQAAAGAVLPALTRRPGALAAAGGLSC